jgi:tetratricopeptide (TPR) repeat protein
MAGFAVAHLDDIDERVDGRCLFRPIRHYFGITGFGVTAWTAHAAGDLILNVHDEGDPTSDEELFLVLRGSATFELNGDRVHAPAGTLIFAPPGAERIAFAEEEGTTIIAIEGTPGAAYDARGWEVWAPLVPLYEAGEYAKVAERLRVEIEASPKYPMLFYNLACCESLSGRTNDALEHLRHAIALSDEFRANAKDDSDLDPIRHDPGFDELMAAS